MTEPDPPSDDWRPYLESEMRRRARRFWTWMALIPAPVLVVLMWADMFMELLMDAEVIAVLLLSATWIIFCTVRIALTWHTFTTELKWLGGIGLALLLALLLTLLNVALFYGLVLASCAVLSR